MHAEEFTDEQLMQRLAAGYDSAFELLFTKYVHKLYLFAFEHISDREFAKELVMDVMFRLWQSREDLRYIKSLNAYLYGAVKNAIIDNYRRKALQLTVLHEGHYSCEAATGADFQLIDRELQQAFNEGVRQLSPQRRLIFEMKREHDLSYKEIAERLTLSPKTVENHMTAAIAFLKKYLRKKTDLAIPLLLLIFLLP